MNLQRATWLTNAAGLLVTLVGWVLLASSIGFERGRPPSSAAAALIASALAVPFLVASPVLAILAARRGALGMNRAVGFSALGLFSAALCVYLSLSAQSLSSGR